jgi:chorismate mutase/prephenate dehydratase
MTDLRECRERIDRIDAQIAELYTERMEVAEAVAQYKIARGMQILDAAREEQKLEQAEKMVPERERPGIREVFALLMKLSRRRQREILQAAGKDCGEEA